MRTRGGSFGRMILSRKWISKMLFLLSIFLVLGTFVHFLASYNNLNRNPSQQLTASDVDLSSSSSSASLSSDPRVAQRLSLGLPPADDPRRGCLLPKITDYNPIYAKKGYKEKTAQAVVCRDEPDWLTVKDGKILFNPASLEQYSAGISCLINYMQRDGDFKQKKKEPAILFDSSNKSVMKLEEDFLWADCKSKPLNFLSTKYKWNDLLAGIKVQDNVLHRHNSLTTTGPAVDHPNQIKSDTQNPLNILVFGFDSVSHVNFMRRLPNLYSYLTQELQAVVLDNYNIVGDGTTAAILAMLAGSYEEELPETRRGKSKTTVDVYPFVFRQFQQNRYVTAYAEDESSIGTFQYRLNGFKDPPADHYMRPFQLQAEAEHKKHPVYCLGSKPKIKILMDWLESIFTQYPPDVGKFVFGFHSEYSHGVVEELSLADEPVTDWVKHLHSSGILNNTVMMVMSDHGHRFSFTRSTLQGKYEERLPFFSIIVPEWFRKRFPLSFKSLQVNALDRLTTPFDVHETLLTLLNDINRGIDVGAVAHDPNQMTRGLSLLREIPIQRSCSDAKISSHWCACNTWEPVDQQTDPRVNRAAAAVVHEINHLIQDSGQADMCSKLSMEKITRSMRMKPKKEMLAFKESSDHDGRIPDLSDKTDVPEVVYEIQVSTEPGNGLFEATVKYSVSTDSFSVSIKEISRVNKYGLTSSCVASRHPHLAKYCYCVNQDKLVTAGYLNVVMG